MLLRKLLVKLLHLFTENYPSDIKQDILLTIMPHVISKFFQNILKFKRLKESWYRRPNPDGRNMTTYIKNCKAKHDHKAECI